MSKFKKKDMNLLTQQTFNDEILIKISKYASFQLVKFRAKLLEIFESVIKPNYWNLAQSIS